MKGHYLARIFTALTGLFLIGYAGRLLSQNTSVSMLSYPSISLILLIVTILFGIRLVALVGRPTLVPTNRRLLLCVGILVIVIAHSTLTDDPAKYIYLKDILKIVGAALVITGPMKMLNTPEAEQKKMMEDVEIIEV